MPDLDKRYYKISEVAEILGIPTSTLRFWENRFTIIKPRRTAGGTRTYSPADIEKIRMVHYLVKERGIKLDVAQEMIRHNHSGVSRRHRAIERLQSIRTQLTGLLAAIDSTNR
ncbi:MAG: MerR family transcriptional regulator [Muribaculaceae bacterium]